MTKFKTGQFIKVKPEFENLYSIVDGSTCLVIGIETRQPTAVERTLVQLPDGQQKWVLGEHFSLV